jgi:hypothetical protein
VELVLRWIKIGLAFSRLVDQKGIGENIHEGEALPLTIISPVGASFGKKSDAGSQQVAKNRELQITFFKISDYQGFQTKMA